VHPGVLSCHDNTEQISRVLHLSGEASIALESSGKCMECITQHSKFQEFRNHDMSEFAMSIGSFAGVFESCNHHGNTKTPSS
jgi:hypothetical protein